VDQNDSLLHRLEQFEFRKTKTKVITLANYKRRENPVNKSKLEADTYTRCEARENVCARITLCYGFSSDWMTKWREFFKTIAQRSTEKPKQTLITFYIQVKTVLNKHS